MMKIKYVDISGGIDTMLPSGAKGHDIVSEYISIAIELSDGDAYLFEVYNGFLFDYMSVPVLFDDFIDPKDELFKVASLIHDICMIRQFKDFEWIGELMYALAVYSIKKAPISKFKKILKLIQARIIRRAVLTNYARGLFSDLSVKDLVNQKFCNIL